MPLIINIQQPSSHFDLAINAEFSASGIIGLFGPSGSGKTTLLRAIAGINNQSSGSIHFNEYNWLLNKEKTKENQPLIGMVFQDSRLFEHLTVAKNFDIVNQTTSTDALSQLMSDLDITPLLNKFAHQLSAGQKQRVAIVRSLIACPQLLLLDEPLSALDNKTKRNIMKVLKKYSQDYALPMIYVSHHIEEIDYLCDELMLIDQGKLIDSGPCKTLLEKHHLLPHQSDIITIDNDKKQITLQLSDSAYNLLSQRKKIKLSD